MSLDANIQEIQTLIHSYHPLLAIETVEEERVELLLQRAARKLKMSFFEWTNLRGLLRATDGSANSHLGEFASFERTKDRAAKETQEPLELLEHIQSRKSTGLFWLKDFSIYLEDPKVTRQLRETIEDFSDNQSAIIITGCNVKLPAEIASDAHFFDIKLPGAVELIRAVKETLRNIEKRRVKIDLDEKEMQMLVQALSGMTLQQARRIISYAAFEDGHLNAEDVRLILERKAQIVREESLLEYFPVADLEIDLGGFSGLKRWLDRARVGFSPEARAINLQGPKGIVIVGIQGCGKSLAAKSIARAWDIPLLKLDAGRLYDKYVGETEKNFRRAIEIAESMAPSVLWIDEIEKGFSSSSHDSDGGLSKRMFGFFLTWMQEKSQHVFVVATANNISQIPPELLRKGRFDEIFFVDLPGFRDRSSIFKIHLARRKQQPKNFDLPRLVEATDGFSGAEIEQVVIASLYQAIYERRPLDTALLLAEIDSTIPLSISHREDIRVLRDMAKERFASVH